MTTKMETLASRWEKAECPWCGDSGKPHWCGTRICPKHGHYWPECYEAVLHKILEDSKQVNQEVLIMSEPIWCDLYEWLYWGVEYKPPKPPQCLNYVRLTPNATVDIRDMFYVPRLQWHPEDTTFISEFEFRRMKKCFGSNYHLCMINPKNIACPDRIACKKEYRERQKKENDYV